MKRFLSLLLCIAVSAGFSIGARASETARAAAPAGDAARGQAIASAVCGACHNPDGNSQISTNPKLAGQHPEYLFKQMKGFKSEGGKKPERVHAVMNSMILTVNEEQMRDIATYFAAQPRKGETAKNNGTAGFGQKLYLAGNMEKGLPACAACHGPAGGGIPAQFPRLAGQFAEYTEVQLRAFREGAQASTPSDVARANDPNQMMRMVALKMTDVEIKAVADYIAGLH